MEDEMTPRLVTDKEPVRCCHRLKMKRHRMVRISLWYHPSCLEVCRSVACTYFRYIWMNGSPRRIQTGHVPVLLDLFPIECRCESAWNKRLTLRLKRSDTLMMDWMGHGHTYYTS